MAKTIDARRLRGVVHVGAYVAFVILTNLLIVAAPGFRSHDEWQKYDAVTQIGLDGFVRAYGVVQAGPEFGFPVRPFGFVQQGILSQWMWTTPIVPHLFDVLLHAAIGLLLVVTLRRAGASARFAWTAAVLFSISPLATFATGWTAASFDQWATLFLLAAAAIVVGASRGGLRPLHVVLMLAVATLAILSKEASLCLPLVVVLTAYGMRLARKGTDLPIRGLAVLVIAGLVPLAAYMVIRLPAIQGSLAGDSVATYSPSISNVVPSAVQYLAYPFLPQLTELNGFFLVGNVMIGLALGLHALLAALLGWAYGWRVGALYVVAYLVYPLMALPLPSPSPQYIHGSAVVMSIGLAALLVRPSPHRRLVVTAVAGLMVAILTVHHFAIQRTAYDTAVCQTRFLTGLDAVIAWDGDARTQGVVVLPDRGAPGWVAQRAVSGRDAYRAGSGTTVVFDPALPGVRVRMAPDCSVLPTDA